jgi:alpha-glucosidase
MMVGEIYLPNEDLVLYYGRNGDECHMPYNFQLIDMPWQANTIREAVDAYEASLPPGAWPNWVLGNHDRPRVASRVGRDQARIANLLLLTLRGTPTTYYGEEISMENVQIPTELVQDPPAVLQPEIADVVGRDPVRTPMLWDDSDHAGFTTSKEGPWLPVSDNYQDINVAQQKEDPYSILNLYRLLSHLRRSEIALHGGSYDSLDSGHKDVFTYFRRHHGADSFIIVLNFGEDQREIDLGDQVNGRATIAISSHMDRAGRVELSSINLAPNEGLVLRLMA